MGQRALWRRWVVFVTVGELAGFSLPALAGIWSAGMPAVAQLALLPLAGLFEGAMLGLAQALVLRGALPGFRPRAWVVATALAAALAWFLGMLPSTTHDIWSTWPVGLAVIVGALLGTVLLISIGSAQAMVLPARTPRTYTWVGWTALGWCAGLTAFSVVAPPLWQEGQAPWLLAVIGLAGGAAMALAMSMVTGAGMVRIVARAVVDERAGADAVDLLHRPGTSQRPGGGA